jgi:two-component system LytT family response regulator
MNLNDTRRVVRVVLADDEPLGRERLERFLGAGLVPNWKFDLLAACGDGAETVDAILRHRPDLALLDVRMPDLDGFGILQAVSQEAGSLPHVVFVTAHDEHAVKAFETHALDFLLKPVSRDRFAKSLARICGLLEEKQQREAQSHLQSWMKEETPQLDAPSPETTWLERIEVRNAHQWDYVPVSDILWLEADGNYIELHVPGRTHLIRDTLQNLEHQLDPARFLRIGRSIMVHLPSVRSIRSLGRGSAVAILSDGAKLHIQRNLQELQRRLQFVRQA